MSDLNTLFADLNASFGSPLDYNRIIGQQIAALAEAVMSLGGESRAGLASVPSGVKSLAVAFSSPLLNANYALNLNWSNLLDADPQYQSLVTVAKTMNGFTVTWPANTDSSNYQLDYSAKSL